MRIINCENISEHIDKQENIYHTYINVLFGWKKEWFNDILLSYHRSKSYLNHIPWALPLTKVNLPSKIKFRAVLETDLCFL